MQNVVDVACSSPPVTMNATKPAAQAVQVGEQDPFDLVLKKASDRIDNEKQSDRASKCSDSKSIDESNVSDFTANNKVSETKIESEVNKTIKADKTEKSESLEESVTNSGKIPETDTNTMIFGFVSTNVPVAEKTIAEAPINLETTGEEVEDAVQPTNLVQFSSTTETSDEKIVPELLADLSQTGVSSSKVNNNELQASLDDVETQIAFSETLNKGAKVGEKTTTDLKPEVVALNETKSEGGKISVSTSTDSEGGKVSVSTSTNSEGESVISIVKNSQEAAPKAVESAEKSVKPVEIATNQKTAPPDNPYASTAAIENASATVNVQNTTQISEPARLAEAPKNEVINQVANQLEQMVKSNRSSVRLQLYPEELGHIDLRIVTTKNGIGVTMVADKASTQQALKSDMDLLRQNIEQAGIQLSNLNINQGHHSNKQQSFEHRQNFSKSSYPGSSSENSNTTAEEPQVHLNASVVDYRV